MDNFKLNCKVCGGEAEIRGRWACAKVVCKECGLSFPKNDYYEEIEEAKERLIREYDVNINSARTWQEMHKQIIKGSILIRGKECSFPEWWFIIAEGKYCITT